jgi:tetratricopeptide (TPR) repeat protein
LISFGVVCGVSALVPVLVLPFLTDVALFQPHRGYAASIGFALATVEVVRALGAAAARWAGPLRPANLAIAGWITILGLVLGAVWADASQGRAWRDEVRFWSDATQRYPREAGYHHSLGAAFLRAGDFPRSLDAFTTAARLDPSLPRVQFNLGLVYTGMGRLDDALVAYERARERDPTDFKSLANLGSLYERQGKMASALEAYRATLRVSPGLGAVRERVDRLERSETISPWNATGPPAVAVQQ